jgi:RNA polymerase subunit RPABC4/transcription elongation factor Spt4
MRTCPICGSAMPPETRFCPSCGSPSSLSCPLCTSSVQDSWHFCPVCSASLLHLCPSCGTFVSVMAKYCKACGWTLAVRPMSETASRPAAVVVARVAARQHAEPADPARLRPLVTGVLAAAADAAENANGIVQRLVGD